MNIELLIAALPTELLIACILSALSLVAVSVPFCRGAAMFLRARRSTRRLEPLELRAGLLGPESSEAEPLSLATLRVLAVAMEENRAGLGHPTPFLRDAAKQYAMNEYDAGYAQPISMYANLLPPLGFIGTTVGLLVLFVSMHLDNATMELGALAGALSSTIFALIGFAILEGLKIQLYRRARVCVDDALGLPLDEFDARREIGTVPAG